MAKKTSDKTRLNLGTLVARELDIEPGDLERQMYELPVPHLARLGETVAERLQSPDLPSEERAFDTVRFGIIRRVTLRKLLGLGADFHTARAA